MTRLESRRLLTISGKKTYDFKETHVFLTKRVIEK